MRTPKVGDIVSILSGYSGITKAGTIGEIVMISTSGAKNPFAIQVSYPSWIFTDYIFWFEESQFVVIGTLE